MGCFSKCFSTCKRRKLKSSVTVTPFKHHSIEVAEEALQIQTAGAEPTKLEELIKAIKHGKESEEKSEEQSKNGDIKKVTFDLNIEANDEETPTKEELSNVLVEICDEKENEEETRKGIEPNSIVSSVVSPSSHPLIHRYEKCKNTEDEDDDCANAVATGPKPNLQYKWYQTVKCIHSRLSFEDLECRMGCICDKTCYDMTR